MSTTFHKTSYNICLNRVLQRGGQTNATFHILQHTREYDKVQQSCMGGPNEYSIIQHPGKLKKCCIVQHSFGEKSFDHDQISYNEIQHDTTR